MEKNSSQPSWLRRLRIVSSMLTIVIAIVVGVQSFVTNYALQTGVVNTGLTEAILKALFVAGWAAVICWVIAAFVSSFFLTAFTKFLVMHEKNDGCDGDSRDGK